MPRRRNAAAWQREQTAALWRTIAVMLAAAVVGVALLVLRVAVLTEGTLGATTEGADAAILLAKKGYRAYR